MFDVTALIKRTNIEARPYQERIVNKTYNLFTEKKLRSVLIESPTGAGKSIMALLIAKAVYEELGFKIGWVAMRRFLLAQAKRENKAKGFNLPLTFISMFDKNPPKDLDMLIVDEAQHDVTGSMGHIHAIIEPKYILGLSATPYRVDRVKLCFDGVIKDAGIPSLIQDGYLSPYHHYTIPNWNVEDVALRYLKEKDRWGKSILYFHRLDQCFAAQKLLLEAGTRVSVAYGGSDIDQQIEDFVSNKLEVMISCMKLTEGLDIPELKTVFVRPSCKGVTIQMCGRVLRKHPDIPFKQIVQCEKTPYPFQKTALAALQHVLVDDAWRTLEVNPELDNVNRRTVRALAGIKVEMPNFIKKKMLSSTRTSIRVRNRTTGNMFVPSLPENFVNNEVDRVAIADNTLKE